MAQLSQDSFATGKGSLSVDEAVAAITSRFSPVEGVETVALADADGRVLAEDLIAPLQLPQFTNSAVDGYAVRGEDVPTSAARLVRVAGRVEAPAPHPAIGPATAAPTVRPSYSRTSTLTRRRSASPSTAPRIATKSSSEMVAEAKERLKTGRTQSTTAADRRA